MLPKLLDEMLTKVTELVGIKTFYTSAVLFSIHQSCYTIVYNYMYIIVLPVTLFKI